MSGWVNIWIGKCPGKCPVAKCPGCKCSTLESHTELDFLKIKLSEKLDRDVPKMF